MENKPLPSVADLVEMYPNAVSFSQAKRLFLSGAKPAYHPPALPSHEERLKLIESPWPSVTVWCGRTWGGLSKRDTLIPNAGEHSWSRSGKGDYETQEDD